MNRNGLCLALAGVLFLALPGASRGQEPPSFERGRALYENHCVVCHTPRVHRRVQRLPLAEEELRSIVVMWARSERLGWSSDDVEDVVHYLNRTHYHFQK